MLWLAVFLTTPFTCWAMAALYFDFPVSWLRIPVASGYGGVMAAILWAFKISPAGILLWFGCLGAVIVWWLRIAPRRNRNWQSDVAELPWAEINGSLATIYNIRDFAYREETDYTPRWETRTVDLSQITGVDLFLTYWVSPWIAHPILSFRFADGTYLAISTETRKEAGQSYSAWRAFFRQFQLIHIIAEERDVVGLRANHRKGESVRLYRTLMKPADARALFVQYLRWMAGIRTRPEWYNALTRNCTTGVLSHCARARLGGVTRYDWRALLNGRGDEMLFELGDLATGGLSFPELARNAVITGGAKHAHSVEDFSRLIRQGRPGFDGANEESACAMGGAID